MLEQISLVNLLQRLESYSKSGLLIVRQDAQWVELYFRDGCLMCIGPVRSSATLGNRLLQERFVSPRVLQETLLAAGMAEPSEMQLALALVERKLISQEQLRNLFMKMAYEVLQTLSFLGNAEVYFEENVAPPADRLLVAIALSPMLSVLNPAPAPTAPPSTEPVTPFASAARPVPTTEQLSNPGPLQPRLTRASEISNAPTLTSPEQFESSSASPNASTYAANLRQGFSPLPAVPASNAIFSEPPAPPAAAGNAGNSYVSVFEQSADGGSFFGGVGDDAPEDRAFVSFLGDDSSEGSLSSPSGRRQPEPVTAPFMPKRIDISFMRPEMILLPSDFSPALVQNPSVQITPEQWMVFALVNGQTSLQSICNGLGTPPTQVCQVVGELIAEGLIRLCMPDGAPVKESTPPRAREAMAPGMNNGGYIAPGYASMPVPSWSPSTPAPEAMGLGNSGSFEAQSQWGNGGNRANFVSGQGWIAPPPSQPLQTSGPLGPRPNMYAPVGRI
jgi:Domain of unknown function (DUF4388)